MIDYKLKPLETEQEDRAKLSPALSSPATALVSAGAGLLRRAPESRSEEIARSRESSAHSFSSAHRAFVRGRSDPNFRQVATYYAERGLEEAKRAREAQAEASNAHVAAQSSEGNIDLHGVGYYDGVRIAMEETERWWDNLGPGRSTKAKAEPLVLVTGVGRHSANGISRLRQGVGAALKRDGWKYVAEEGRFLVKGKI